jgi:hypothetical protein
MFEGSALSRLLVCEVCNVGLDSSCGDVFGLFFSITVCEHQVDAMRRANDDASDFRTVVWRIASLFDISGDVKLTLISRSAG